MPQHLEALQLGNKIRLDRAAVKRHIESLPRQAGQEAICELIMDPGDLWATEKLDRVLRFPALRGSIFSHRVRSTASDFEVLPAEKQLGSLTDRQRERICAVIRGQR